MVAPPPPPAPVSTPTGGGGSGGTVTAPPAPVSAAEGDEKQPVVEPKADKPDKPVAKPTSTTLRSVGATRMESTSASRSQLNALSAAADQANEPPITEVEIALEALAALRVLSRGSGGAGRF